MNNTLIRLTTMIIFISAHDIAHCVSSSPFEKTHSSESKLLLPHDLPVYPVISVSFSNWSQFVTGSVFFFLLVFAIVHQFKIIILLTSAKVGIIFELCKFLDDYLHGRIILA